MRYSFRLYVAGAGLRSAAAERDFRLLCDEHFSPDQYDLTVIDVLEDLDEADTARILVTPTVVRTRPLPVIRVMGDLSATTEIAHALGFPGPSAPEKESAHPR